MEENGDLAIGFLTGTAEGTREAARLHEAHLWEKMKTREYLWACTCTQTRTCRRIQCEPSGLFGSETEVGGDKMEHFHLQSPLVMVKILDHVIISIKSSQKSLRGMAIDPSHPCSNSPVWAAYL